MATPSHDTVVAELTALVDGLTKHQPNTPFIFAGRTYKGRELIAELRLLLAAAKRVVTARAELTDAIRDHRALQAGKAELVHAIRQRLRIMYSNNSAKLADFALEPPRAPRPMSTETLLVRAAKGRATRAKRGTLGKNQKAAIKGKVTRVVITPITGKDPKEK
jgi:hypothetical protein